jgi:hypothetical protein
MKPEIKEQWVAALRSGEFKQGRGSLRKGDLFCCLGVLTDLFVRATGAAWNKIGGAMGIGEEGACLPRLVMEWAGLDNPNPYILDQKGRLLSAASLNDHGATFAEIADAIERTPTDDL